MLFHPATVQQHANSPWGAIALAASPLGLCGVWFQGQRHEPADLLYGPDAWPHASQHPLLGRALEQLQAYWSGQSTGFDLPLDNSSGTPFQQAVWQELRQIGYGHTCSYADVAQRLHKPSAVRAVAAAIAHNPISLIVPCHRVLGRNGHLTGYAGGLERKAALLALESLQKTQCLSTGLTPSL